MARIRTLRRNPGRTAPGSRCRHDRFDSGVDHGPLSGRAPHRRTRPRPVPQTGLASREERGTHRAVHGLAAPGHRLGKDSALREESMITDRTIDQILAIYDDKAALSEAFTIPAPWYVDPRIAELEQQSVFSKTWQVIGRNDPVEKP